MIAPVIPAECKLDPVEPVAVDQPTLTPVPDVPTSASPAAQLPYEQALRAQAQQAASYYRALSDAIFNAYDRNVQPQRACSTWARSQP